MAIQVAAQRWVLFHVLGYRLVVCAASAGQLAEMHRAAPRQLLQVGKRCTAGRPAGILGRRMRALAPATQRQPAAAMRVLVLAVRPKVQPGAGKIDARRTLRRRGGWRCAPPIGCRRRRRCCWRDKPLHRRCHHHVRRRHRSYWRWRHQREVAAVAATAAATVDGTGGGCDYAARRKLYVVDGVGAAAVSAAAAVAAVPKPATAAATAATQRHAVVVAAAVAMAKTVTVMDAVAHGGQGGQNKTVVVI
ncbi:hypothetical protein BX070DRAFT_245626 [Coemansia spiralis]|nr:hypothetical protein BX070DRAFT_245624 [Coemansia spiralis]KAI9504341.1 hypothetical protein BX070DRAFT_245626 [Coemansia spiralis]